MHACDHASHFATPTVGVIVGVKLIAWLRPEFAKAHKIPGGLIQSETAPVFRLVEIVQEIEHDRQLC
jgi:hypothetical protein